MRSLTVLALVVSCAKATRETPDGCDRPITVPVSYATYPVHGATWDEVERSIRATSAAPDGFDGWTAVEFSFACHQRGDEMTIEFESPVVITVPEWVERDAASESLQSQWTHYISGLEEHERGHYQIYQVGYQCIAEHARQQPDCDRAKAWIQKAVDSVEDQQSAFDIATDHGRYGTR